MLELKSDSVECEFKELKMEKRSSKGEEGGSGVEAVEY